MDDDFGDLSAEELPAAPKPVPAPPKAKRSLFTKKIKATLPENDEPVDFFSRAKDIYPLRRAEEERRYQKKQVKLERKRSSTSAEVKEKSPNGEKKRRVSVQRDGYSSDENAVRPGSAVKEDRRDSAHSSHTKERYQNRGEPTSLSARYSKDLSARKPDSPKKDIAKGYVSLSDSGGDGFSGSESDNESYTGAGTRATRQANKPIDLDDDDDEVVITKRVIRPPPPPVEDDANMSEEEFPELVAAAKERARQQALLKETQNHGDVDGDDVFDSEGPAKNIDPVIEILITSKIQGTFPVAVKRKLFGRLKEVRWAWCDKQVIDGQKMSPEMKETIFLTWKGNKLFDWSDCSGCVDGGGKLSLDNDDDDGKIHLEAWTGDLFEEWKKGHEARQRGEREQSEEEAVEEVTPVQQTKLIMKSRQHEDYKLKVKGITTIQKMIDAFRLAREIPEDKEITLHFDGDKLEPDDKIEDTELGDLDSVEVHIQ